MITTTAERPQPVYAIDAEAVTGLPRAEIERLIRAGRTIISGQAIAWPVDPFILAHVIVMSELVADFRPELGRTKPYAPGESPTERLLAAISAEHKRRMTHKNR